MGARPLACIQSVTYVAPVASYYMVPQCEERSIICFCFCFPCETYEYIPAKENADRCMPPPCNQWCCDTHPWFSPISLLMNTGIKVLVETIGVHPHTLRIILPHALSAYNIRMVMVYATAAAVVVVHVASVKEHYSQITRFYVCVEP